MLFRFASLACVLLVSHVNARGHHLRPAHADRTLFEDDHVGQQNMMRAAPPRTFGGTQGTPQDRGSTKNGLPWTVFIAPTLFFITVGCVLLAFMYALSYVFMREKEDERNDWHIVVRREAGDGMDGRYYPGEVSAINPNTRVWHQEDGQGVLQKATMYWALFPTKYDSPLWQSSNPNSYYDPDQFESGSIRPDEIPPTSQWGPIREERYDTELLYYENGLGDMKTENEWSKV
jgi:hypothetical protein